MKTLIITDLHVTHRAEGEAADDVRELSREELRQILGGRAVGVTVDGTSSGTVDDFQMNIAIFEGRIKGTFL